MNTSTEALFAAVVAAAQAANEREATLATFAHLLAQAAGADAAHVYLYDDARRLIPHRDASLDLLQEHWATVGQSIW
ncbi:MAG: hypothetical protein H7Z42_22455, partial [Roseiflexaceae bacterium]|nr:hypothetical protein [Roseiflexaceae bacterium]